MRTRLRLVLVGLLILIACSDFHGASDPVGIERIPVVLENCCETYCPSGASASECDLIVSAISHLITSGFEDCEEAGARLLTRYQERNIIIDRDLATASADLGTGILRLGRTSWYGLYEMIHNVGHEEKHFMLNQDHDSPEPRVPMDDIDEFGIVCAELSVPT